MSDTPFSGRRSARAPAPIDLNPDARRDHRVLMPTGEVTPAPPPGDRLLSLEGQAFGEPWTVRLILPTDADEAALRAAVDETLTTFAALSDDADPRSEVSRFNTAPAGVWALSKPFWALLDQSMNVADETNGAFDPTLGALARLWDGPAPDAAAVEAALTVSGWRALRLNREARGAMQVGGMGLDFRALIGGHAADQLSERLTREGATSHLVSVGGVMRGAGVKPDAEPWLVGVDLPEELDAPRTVAALFDLALATSADPGATVSLTLDGATGRPIDNGLIAVTVLDASAARADAWATALRVMGPYEGPPYAEMAEIAAHFVERTARGLIEHMSPAFKAMLGDPT